MLCEQLADTLGLRFALLDDAIDDIGLLAALAELTIELGEVTRMTGNAIESQNGVAGHDAG